jgi:hypothetical protein
VLHVTAIARPATWGYLLLGPERGLAWCWWFQLFVCFLGLYLLFELLVPRRPWFAVLGAGWFCGSAYVVYWSLWPAYVTGLGVLALVGAYWLLRSSRPGVVIACGVLVGVAFAAFCMQLYPPWQVPLGHTFLVLFAGLIWRDRLWEGWPGRARLRLGALGLALLCAGVLLGSFYASSVDALSAFAHSDYPGERRIMGGDCPAWRLFGSFYNAFANSNASPSSNPSEASGFFLLLPAAVVALAVSPRIRSRVGPLDWALLLLAGLLVYFCVSRVPEWLATVTLLAHAPGYRAQIALGLISIIVSVRLLAITRGLPHDRQALLTAAGVFIACTGFHVWQGLELDRNLDYFGQSKLPAWVGIVSLMAALASVLLVLGRVRPFAALLALALWVTSADFNPLSIGFPDWRTSELATAIQRAVPLQQGRGEQRDLWLTYGGVPFPNGGTLVQLMGRRALAGVYYYPQVELWKPLDPDGEHRLVYNRFAATRLHLPPLSSRDIDFRLSGANIHILGISPLHPALRELGARYVLTFGAQPGITAPRFKLLYQSKKQDFAIWELP